MPDIKEIRDKHRSYLESLRNVETVSIGPKVIKGKPTDRIAIKVFVSRKMSLSDLSKDERIPEEIEGFPTDVEAVGPLTKR